MREKYSDFLKEYDKSEKRVNKKIEDFVNKLRRGEPVGKKIEEQAVDEAKRHGFNF